MSKSDSDEMPGWLLFLLVFLVCNGMYFWGFYRGGGFE